ncbi:unnamed protein product [Trichogramma brassicae]|uniref:Uncharacterized protein n=1 Tax=Trichogramma brassicae TaxID=86971 RepID=A0A6H5IJ39_9HYME|nr:unnamed protein product [Trichogramma brassicae]
MLTIIQGDVQRWIYWFDVGRHNDREAYTTTFAEGTTSHVLSDFIQMIVNCTMDQSIFGRAGPRYALGSNQTISSDRHANARHTGAAAQFDPHTYTTMHANTRVRATMPRTEHMCFTRRLRRKMADATLVATTNDKCRGSPRAR